MKTDPLSIRPAVEARRISEFIRKTVAGAHASGVVVGLSGGIDSAVVGALCVRALGKDGVLGLLMPSDHTPKEDLEDARSLAKGWGIRAREVGISNIVEGLVSAAKLGGDRIAKANVQARVRMTILYYFSNSQNLLVAGTGDRSESLAGYFSKFGDGGVDFLPIVHLYKTQVRALGKYLGLPDRVVKKPPSPQLWPGHRATDELPADYDRLDTVLHYLFDEKLSSNEATRKAGVDRALVQKVIEMHEKSAHKRTMPPSLSP